MMDSSIEKILFEAARNLEDVDERETLLDYACRDNSSLRSRLKNLLRNQIQAETFFDFQPEITPPETTGENGEQGGIGAHIGRYRLITLLGSGGCGSVYLAEQEEPVRRKVALKIIRFGMDTEAVIIRFDLERQALAQMDHPNISRVLDAGATQSGRPYFVMEAVDGEKITDFCDAHFFTVRQRVELFVQICRAIQHAHQKSIVHLDIKPSNILLGWHDGVAVPKVIDFGIAKATEHSSLEDSVATGPDRFFGTPAYMSPEQAQARSHLDTRSDIYSLGVVLYELLCGKAPLKLDHITNIATDEIRRIIREEKPVPPSVAVANLSPAESSTIAAKRGTSVRRLVAHLSEDLDAIVLKTLEKEPSRRYDTATGLAMELVRYLNDEVILARPPSRVDRLKKLIRRNKLASVALGIAFFVLIVFCGTITYMFLQEKSARQEQERLRHKAEYRELVARAAVKVKYGDLAAADELLRHIPSDQIPSSLEAAETFNAVGDWHISGARFREASARYGSMMRAIAAVDDADLPSVSIDLLPGAAASAYAVGYGPYEEIRQIAIKHFSSTANPIVAEQSLKGCLLLPPDAKTLQALRPLSDMLQKIVDSGGVKDVENRDRTNSWIYFVLELMYYRTGDYAVAMDCARHSLVSPVKNEARKSSTLIVMAMIDQKLGHPNEAQAALEEARGPVLEALEDGDSIHTGPVIFWFDWIIADILLNEADRAVSTK